MSVKPISMVKRRIREDMEKTLREIDELNSQEIKFRSRREQLQKRHDQLSKLAGTDDEILERYVGS